ncbi:hypothetical protein ACFWBF_01740 [Streptomyces sp. NPDC060028]|uniref:hypothetical protein n=1 Tax=Streptomyces sp. NPDC060028 TaxID=3347041 RepID=UPI003699C4D2
MTKPLYTPETEADTELAHLGYNASVHDLVVQAAHKELNRFLVDEGEALRMWGWDPNSLHAADRYRVAQLLRAFIYQEQSIVAALKWLDERYRAYVDASPQNRQKAEAFVDSLNRAAARRAIDFMVDRVPGAGVLVTSAKRDRIAKDLVAKWQKEAPNADAHAAPAEREPGEGGGRFGYSYGTRMAVLEQGEWLVADVIADSLKGVPGLSQMAKTIAERPKVTDQWGNEQPYDPDEWGGDRYLPPVFRRMHTLRSIVDFHDPEIARELGRRSGNWMADPWDSEGNERPEDTTFKGSGFDMDLWRLKDLAYPGARIPDGPLYDLVDTALAVQAEYQLQCFFVDRELCKVIETRGKEERWLYEKTAAWAVERARAEAEAKAKAAGFWGLVGDILGLVSAAAGILALIPVLTPIMAPIAIVSALGSLGAHAAAATIQGDWDAATIAGLGADALAALPVVGAVAKGAKGAWAAARMNKAASVIVRQSGRAFVGAIAGKGASDATRFFDHLGRKGAGVVSGTAVQSKIPGKVLQGAVSLSTQVPLIVELSGGSAGQPAKDTATGTALTANIGQTVGEWDTVGAFATKAGTVSIERFSRFFSKV